MEQAHDQHDAGERARVQGAADHRPQHLPQGQVRGPHRRGQRGVVGLGVLDQEEHVERGVVDGPVHGRGRQQRRGHVGGVADPADGADQVPEPDPDRQQVEQRLPDSGEDHQP